MNDIITHYLNLPHAVKGMVLPTPDGDYEIIINAAYSREQQQQIYHHEMRHILLGHYQQPCRPLPILEAEASSTGLLDDRIVKVSFQGLALPVGPVRPSTVHIGGNAPPLRAITAASLQFTRPCLSACCRSAQLHRIRKAALTGFLA